MPKRRSDTNLLVPWEVVVIMSSQQDLSLKFWKCCITLRGLKRWKMPQILSLSSWKPALPETFFLFPQQVESVNLNVWSGFFKFAFEIKLCWETRPRVNFGPFFGTKRWIPLERNKISKIANRVLEQRQLRRSVPNFKTKASAVRKLKGKGNCENEHRETASFMHNFVQKTNATKLLWWHFIPTLPLNFFTRFSPEYPF